MIRRTVVAFALAAVGAFFYSIPAFADNIHLCDINTTCNAGSVIPIFSGNTQDWVFGKSSYKTPGPYTLNIAVLTPQSGTGGNFNSNTNLWQVLLGTAFQNFPNFASTASQEFGATGIAAGSFNATSFAVGTWTGTNSVGQLFNLPANVNVGDIFVAFLTDSSGNLIAVSPWSSSLIFVPEPSSLRFLSVGLLGLAALAGRRLLGN